jgi:hypothetical protein
MPTLEIFTMLGGSIVGFIFRYMAERAKDRQDQFKMMMESRQLAIKEKDQASQVDGDMGKTIRRFIVICIMFAVIMAPFLLSLIGISTIVEIQEVGETFLFGLFGGGTETKFIELNGYLMIPEVRQTLSALVGFYFGNASASCKT